MAAAGRVARAERGRTTFAASVAGRAPAGALRDGWDLARELHRRGELGDAAAVELAEREVTLHRDGRRRRLPAVRRCADGCRRADSAAGCYQRSADRSVDVAHPTFPHARTVGVAS